MKRIMGCSEVILTTHSFHEHMFPISFRLDTVLVLGEGKLNTVPALGTDQLNLVLREPQEGGLEGPGRDS